jgi:ribosomal protein L21
VAGSFASRRAIHVDVDLLDVEAGKTATFGDVLLFADGKDVTHGDPLVSGAKVTAEVLEHRKDKKVVRSNTGEAKAITARSATAAN